MWLFAGLQWNQVCFMCCLWLCLSALQVVAEASVFKVYKYEELKDQCPPDVPPNSKEVRELVT